MHLEYLLWRLSTGDSLLSNCHPRLRGGGKSGASQVGYAVFLFTGNWLNATSISLYSSGNQRG